MKITHASVFTIGVLASFLSCVHIMNADVDSSTAKYWDRKNLRTASYYYMLNPSIGLGYSLFNSSNYRSTFGLGFVKGFTVAAGPRVSNEFFLGPCGSYFSESATIIEGRFSESQSWSDYSIGLHGIVADEYYVVDGSISLVRQRYDHDVSRYDSLTFQNVISTETTSSQGYAILVGVNYGIRGTMIGLQLHGRLLLIPDREMFEQTTMIGISVSNIFKLMRGVKIF